MVSKTINNETGKNFKRLDGINLVKYSYRHINKSRLGVDIIRIFSTSGNSEKHFFFSMLNINTFTMDVKLKIKIN